MVIHDLPVRPSTRNYLVKRFSEAFLSPQLTDLLLYLLFCPEQRIPVHRDLLANIFQISASHNRKDEVLKDCLHKLQLPFKLSEHSYAQRQCRLLEIELDPETQNVMQEELLRGPERGLVYFKDGLTYSEKKHRAEIRRGHHSTKLQEGPNKCIIQYFRGLPDRVYRPYLPNIAPAKEYAWQNFPPEKAIQQLKTLHVLQYKLKPDYVQHDTTDRVFASGSSLQNLSKEIRRILLPDTFELDLKNCYFALAASFWGIHQLQDLLNSDTTIWKVLLADLGLESTPSHKAQLKKASYTLMFGGGKGKIKEALEGWPEELQNKFLTHWIIAEILEGRSKEYAQMKRDGGIQLGSRFCELKRPKQLSSLLARKFQYYETCIIAGAYRCAIEAPRDLRIYSHEHDGCSAKVLRSEPRRRERILERLQLAIQQEASNLGIKVQVEISGLAV